MNRTTHKYTVLICALLGAMVANPAKAATLRYVLSGDYNDIASVTLANGWQDGGGGPGGLPGSADLIRVNWGNNTVTLTNVAPNVAQFQLGVDESGTLVVESGGSLTAIGGNPNTVGNNKTGVTGQLKVMTNGVVNSAAVLRVGYGNSSSGAATGILTIDGGTLNQSNHLWVGGYSAALGTIILTNGGTLNMLGVNGNGMLGLGTGNATSASGGTGTIKVSDGSVLNLYNISSSAQGSIQPGSVLDISGSGIVTIPDNRITTMSGYTNAGRITAYGGTGTVGIDYDTLNPGKTTLFAIVGYTPPTEVVWDPAANPSTTGLWSEGANWALGGGYPPASVTKVMFSVPNAIPCTVNNAAAANHVLMGTNGPGGTLIITNGGSLACGADEPSVIGVNSNAVMIVENGGSANFGNQLWIGSDWGSDGKLIMNGGTVSVAGMFVLGSFTGGAGTAQIKGGALRLSQWDEYSGILGSSVLDVTGTGVVVINGDQRVSVEYYVSVGLITNSIGTNVLVDYGLINLGKTTIYPADLYLPPAQVVWNPAANPSGNGLWNECASWTGGLCPGNVTVTIFNVPDAVPCTVTNAALAGVVRMGVSGGPGGTLIITNGGSLVCATADDWNGIGYSSNALMIVENGASASFGYHLWVGYNAEADGTLIINGGTVSVGGQFGLGWNGGKGTVQVNGGTLNLSQIHPTDSIKGSSVLNITGTGTVMINGNQLTPVGNYIGGGKIKADGGSGVVAYGYDPDLNKTILQVAPPRQSVTGVAVSGGNATLTWETTPGHIYHIESSPSLSPAAWTRVAGSSTNAAGSSVTVTFPTTGDQTFYRAVSP